VPQPVEVPEDNAPPQVEDEAKGVVRLLLAGHFKGVADVRLRMNFFEEIQTRQSAAVAPVVEETLPDLLAAVDSAVQSIQGDPALTEDQSLELSNLKDTFVDETESIRGAFLGGNASSPEGFLSSLRVAIDGFVHNLGLLLGSQSSADAGATEVTAGAPTGETESPDETITQSPEGDLTETEAPPAGDLEPATPPPAPADMLASLSDTLTAWLDELSAALADASVLPPLSPAQGNGVAYQKFLSMYQEMQDLG